MTSMETKQEHDFSQGVRGRYQGLINQPRVVHIRNQDGTITRKQAPALMEIDDDVYAYFPTSQAVNDALRGLIALLPQKAS